MHSSRRTSDSAADVVLVPTGEISRSLGHLLEGMVESSKVPSEIVLDEANVIAFTSFRFALDTGVILEPDFGVGVADGRT